MFEDQINTLPANPPRSPALLPGLRITSVMSRAGLVLPVAFVATFALMPVFIMSADPEARLALGSTDTIDGRVVTATASGCANSVIAKWTSTGRSCDGPAGRLKSRRRSCGSSLYSSTTAVVCSVAISCSISRKDAMQTYRREDNFLVSRH